MANKMNIDKAWTTLYSRLEKDQLLPVEKEKSASRMFFYQRVAAVAILVLTCAGLVYWWSGSHRKSQWLTQQNNDASNTLITQLEDGSVVYLAGNAVLTYPEKFETDKRRIKVEGDVLVDVSRDKNRPFYVETAQVLIEVLGTAFRIQSPKEKTFFELSVERGQVRVTQKNTGKHMIVVAGQTVQLHSGVWSKNQMEDVQLFDQYTSKMKFKDERLDNVVRIINAVTDKPIVLENGLEDRVLTVTFDNHSAGSMAKLICLALQLNYKDKQDTLYISR